jgi:hypothetical protein
LAGGIPLSAAAFDAVSIWLEREHAIAVRRAAAGAVSGIDNYRAGELIAPLLSLEDPELPSLLQSLHHPRAGGSEWVRNPRAIDALIGLAGQIRALHMTEGRHAVGNESHMMLAALQIYFHPRMLPVLHGWAMADDHVSSAQALSNLSHLVGLPIERGATAAYDAWWKDARDVVSRHYDLSREEDLAAWLTAYHSGDETTRRMLLRLWMFEQQPDAAALLRIARDDDAAKTGAAKAALSELWQNKRLAAAVKRAIVELFLEVELVEPAESGGADGYRHLLIVVTRNFPFPRDAWVEPNSAFAIEGELPPLGDSWGAFSLDGSGKMTVGSRSGGNYRGTPEARAMLALREVDHAAGGKVLWRIDWPLKLKLRPSK